jgi:DNA-binding transcriptional regulator PaaX
MRGQQWIILDSIHSLDQRGSLMKYRIDNQLYIDLTDKGKRRFRKETE